MWREFAWSERLKDINLAAACYRQAYEISCYSTKTDSNDLQRNLGTPTLNFPHALASFTNKSSSYGFALGFMIDQNLFR